MKFIQYITLLFVFSLQAETSINKETDTLHYPVTVDSCGQKLTFHQAPRRAVFNDLNMVEMAFHLGLQPHIVAVSSISGWYKTGVEFKHALGDIPEISPRYLALEPLINVKPDFLFAGWNYGLRVGTELTPENFATFGITTLALSESCVHVNKKRENASMRLLYDDILKLGLIFNKNKEAKHAVTSWKNEIALIREKVSDLPKKKVFLYDSGIDKPLTSGRFAMPQALIDAAGGENVMVNADFSWSNTSWEHIAMTDPDLIILVDYNSDGAMGPEQRKTYLKKHPLMRHTKAVKTNNYILLGYGEITPGPKNIKAVHKIAQALYPEVEI